VYRAYTSYAQDILFTSSANEAEIQAFFIKHTGKPTDLSKKEAGGITVGKRAGVVFTDRITEQNELDNATLREIGHTFGLGDSDLAPWDVMNSATDSSGLKFFSDSDTKNMMKELF
jgi:hypothetical protein